MSKPSPAEVKAVAKILDPDVSEEALDMARECIEALDEVRVKKDQWILAARTMRDGPIVAVGPWTTKNQALRAVDKVAFVDAPADTEGVGALIFKVRQPEWLASVQ